MTQPYRIVVGLEVHVQLLTETKLYCGCSSKFGGKPNSQTCPVCLGLPGSLPVMNRTALELALRAGKALSCRFNGFTKWDRKNYYYPDLPKNYQISQYDLPFAEEGRLEIEAAEGPKQIRLIRVHLEEDAGKNLHGESGGKAGGSLVDLNRAGTPLLEIVSQPDLSSPAEAKAYLEKMRRLMRDLKVSDCEMQEGSLRCNANVNLHIPLADGKVAKTPLVEIKNLNSFRAIEKAVAYEAVRQYEQYGKDKLEIGQRPKQTCGWDDAAGVTRVQREKEEASDYRYFPEPDLAPVLVDDAMLAAAAAQSHELSADRKARYQQEHGLSDYNAGVLVDQGQASTDYFDELLRLGIDPKSAANWIINDLLARSTGRIKSVADFPVAPSAFAGLIALVKASKLNLNDAREKVLPAMVGTGRSADAIAKEMGLEVVADVAAIEAVCAAVMAEMAPAVADVRAGKEKALGSIVGQVMKRGKGKFPPAVVNEVLRKMIG